MHAHFIDRTRLVISGEVKTLDNYTEIRNLIQDFIASGEKVLVVEVIDSMMITSAIIGYFTKIIHLDGIRMTMIVHNQRLYELLQDLNLIKMFNVKKEIF